MLGLTNLGIIHTAISLAALGAGIVALVRDREISPRNFVGKLYIWTTVLTCLTGFPIMQHGGFGKPHALGIITLVVLVVAALAGKSKFGGASRYIETVSYSATFFFHLIPTLVETTTRLPVGSPLIADRDGPELQTATGVLFLLFLIGATLQVWRMRGQGQHRVQPVRAACVGWIALSTTMSAFAGHAAATVPQSRFADVNGIRMRYRIAGQGSPVVLLHGYAQDSRMWLPLMAELAKTHTVIAPDLRGFGQSSAPTNGYTKAAMAQDVHALVQSLGHKRVSIVGHDIGLMVAYAYAAQYRDEVDRIALLDAFLPGVGDWKNVWLMRDLWHFHFYGEVPLALVKGRERTYFEHFWNDFAADRTHSIPEHDRRLYAKAYAQPGHMRAGFEVFRAFEQDAKDFAGFARTPLPMPMLVLTGEKASGEFLIQQGRLAATNVEGVVVPGSGHWMMEEAPDKVIPKLVEFLNR